MSFPGRTSGSGIKNDNKMPSSGSALNAELLALEGAANSRIGGGRRVLPPGVLETDVPIDVGHHISLEGSGAGTIIKAAPGFTGPIIRNRTTSSRRFRVKNLTVWGYQAGASCDGIVFNTPQVGGNEYSDGMWGIEDVQILECSGKGLLIQGRGDGKARNMDIRDIGGVGLKVEGVDNFFDGIVVGTTGSHGVELNAANNRFTNCKAYYNGMTTIGHSWYIHDCVLFALNTCEAQDASGHGWYFVEAYNWGGVNLIADSNGSGRSAAGAFAGSGFRFNGADTFQLTGQARDRNANPTRQQYAIDFEGWYGAFDISMGSFGNQGGSNSGHWINRAARGSLSAKINGVQTTLT